MIDGKPYLDQVEEDMQGLPAFLAIKRCENHRLDLRRFNENAKALQNAADSLSDITGRPHDELVLQLGQFKLAVDFASDMAAKPDEWSGEQWDDMTKTLVYHALFMRGLVVRKKEKK